MLWKILLLIAMPASLLALEWHYQTSGVTTTLRDVCFVDSLHGWAVGDSGTIIHTSDGGENWQKQNSPTDRTLWRVSFINHQDGFITADIHSNFLDYKLDWKAFYLATNDGGQTWRVIETNLSRLFCLHFVSSDTGWVGGYFYDATSISHQSAILFTSDGGQTWDSQPLIGDQSYDLMRDIIAIQMSGPKTGWALSKNYQLLSSNMVFQYSDSGTSWQKISKDQLGFTPHYTDELNIISLDTLWAYGRSFFPSLFYSFDGGSSWQEPREVRTKSPDLYDVLPINGSSAWLLYEYKLSLLRHTNELTDVLVDSAFLKYAVDGDGKKRLWLVGGNGGIIKVDVSNLPNEVKSATDQPETLALRCYPNPFNSQIRLETTLPETGFFTVMIYNSLGKAVKTWRHASAVLYWDGLDDKGRPVPAGIYFCRAGIDNGAGESYIIKKLCLVK